MRSQTTNDSNRRFRPDAQIDQELQRSWFGEQQNSRRSQSQPPFGHSGPIAALRKVIAAEPNPFLEKQLALGYLQAIQERMVQAASESFVSPKTAIHELLAGQNLVLNFECPEEPPAMPKGRDAANLLAAFSNPSPGKTTIHDRKHILLHKIRLFIFQCERRDREMEMDKLPDSAKQCSVPRSAKARRSADKDLELLRQRVNSLEYAIKFDDNPVQKARLQEARILLAKWESVVNSRLQALQFKRIEVDVRVISTAIEQESVWMQAFLSSAHGGGQMLFESAQDMLERVRKDFFNRLGKNI